MARITPDITREALLGYLGGISQAGQAGAETALKTYSELEAKKLWEQYQQLGARRERVDVGVMDVLRDPEMGIMEDEEFRLLTPEEQIQTIREGELLPGAVRRPAEADPAEQRRILKETRLQAQFEHRKEKDRKAGNKDLFRTSLSLLRALRQEDKENPTEERRFQIDDTVDEMIRYAKNAGINIRDWIKEEYQEDPTFWDRILGRPGVKKERLIEKPRPTKTPTFTTQEEVIAAFEKRDITEVEALRILKEQFGAE